MTLENLPNSPTPSTPESHENAHDKQSHPQSETSSRSDVHIKPPNSHYEITCNKKRDGWDRAKMGAEFLGILFLIVYTLYTAGIYCANQRAANAAQSTFKEIQNQTTLMRQQLVGTMGAVVVFNGNGPATEPYPIREPRFNVNVGLKNDGHVIAHDVETHFTVQVLKIADGTRVGRQWTCGTVINALPPSTPQRPGDYSQCFIDAISAKDFQDITDHKSTLAVEGTFAYDDGFGDRKTQSFCLRYVHPITTKKYGFEGVGSLLGCDDFPRWIALQHQHLAEDQP